MLTTRSILLTLLVGLGFAVAGCSLDTSVDADETVGLNETTALEQENTTIDVTVTNYRFVEGEEQADDGGTITPPGETKLLYVRVRVENIGSESGATPAVGVRPTANATVPAANPAWMGGDVYYTIRNLPAGSTKSGWIKRAVPGNTTASDVEFAFSTDVLITGDEYRWRLD